MVHLAGLVGITAGADQMSWGESIIIGMIAGGLVVFSAVLLDRLKLDDCVGAVSVHLTCGIWGTLAVGIFGQMASVSQFIIQLVSVLTVGGFVVAISFALFYGPESRHGCKGYGRTRKIRSGQPRTRYSRGYTIVYDR